MARFALSGLSDAFQQYEGEYEPVVPTTGDQRSFRLAAGIDPEEMTKILESGAIEGGALIIYATLRRAGRLSDAAEDAWQRKDLVEQLFDLPMDVLAGIIVQMGQEDGEGDADVPPESEPAAKNDGGGSDDSSGSDSEPYTAVPV